jgi:hypothetical protein
MAETDREAVLRELSQRLVREGKLIEAGWISLRLVAIPADAPELQIEEMRNAFFAGAQHLFASILSVLDPGEEPTAADLQRFDNINDELTRFIDDYKRRKGITLEH